MVRMREMRTYNKMEIEERILKTIKGIRIKHVIIMLIVIAIGLFIFNQLLELSYKYILLTEPCELCDQYMKYNSHTFNLNLSELIVQNLTIQ